MVHDLLLHNCTNLLFITHVVDGHISLAVQQLSHNKFAWLKSANFIYLRNTWLADMHLFNGLFSRTTCATKQHKVKPIWILMKQEMTGWPWHQLDHMQIICTLLHTDNHASTSSLKFLQAGCSYWCPTCSVKVLKEIDDLCKKTAVPKLQCSTDCFMISSVV